MTTDGWISLQEAANYAGGVTPQTIKNWMTKRTPALKGRKIGGVYQTKIEYLDEFSTPIGDSAFPSRHDTDCEEACREFDRKYGEPRNGKSQGSTSTRTA